MIAVVALALAQPAAEFKPNAKLGEFYLLGPRATVSGSNEKLEIGLQRLVKIRSARTALAFASKHRTFVAGEGKKLILLYATVKNPEGFTAYVTSSDSIGLRVFGTGLKESDFNYEGAVAADLGQLDRKLKKGESVDFIQVYQAPSSMSTLRIAPYYRNYDRNRAAKYDLTKVMDKPTSHFAVNPLLYTDRITVPASTTFDFDALSIKFIGTKGLPDNGMAVTVQVTNPNLLPEKWGWQYATATLSAPGLDVAFYPDFYVTSQTEWRGEIAPGQSVIGEYRFYPGKQMTPTAFTLELNATKRSAVVSLP